MNPEEKRNKPSLRQKVMMSSIKSLQKVAVKKGYKNMVKISDKHRAFIDEIQDRCGKIIELEPENQQPTIVATVCANIIQGFDTKKEMDIVIEMIQTAVNEYWKIEDIPQKGGLGAFK